jgi:hypothetical protein
MYIVAMAIPIDFVPNAMFPIASLPNTHFAMLRTIRRHWDGRASSRQELFREKTFDVRPAKREVIVPVR